MKRIFPAGPLYLILSIKRKGVGKSCEFLRLKRAKMRRCVVNRTRQRQSYYRLLIRSHSRVSGSNFDDLKRFQGLAIFKLKIYWKQRHLLKLHYSTAATNTNRQSWMTLSVCYTSPVNKDGYFPCEIENSYYRSLTGCHTGCIPHRYIIIRTDTVAKYDLA